MTIVTNIKAQSWHPFPKDQLSYYKHTITDREDVQRVVLECYQSDSLWYESLQCYVHFLADNVYNNECFWLNGYNFDLQRLQEVKCQYGQCLYDSRDIQGFINKNDTVLLCGSNFGFDNKNPIVFKPNCQLGDSWVTNNRKFTCQSTSTMVLFGTTDSVKTFNIDFANISSKQLILSKNYGLVKFFPLHALFVTNPAKTDDFELIGCQKNNLNLGYQYPEFKDYFHLQPGDMLYYIDKSWVPGENFIDLYHKDSIIHVEIKADSIIYQFIRTNYDDNFNYLNESRLKDVYTQKKEGAIIENRPRRMGPINGTSFSDIDPVITYNMITELIFGKDDTITKIKASIEPIIYHPEVCYLGYIVDAYSEEFEFSTKEGIIQKTINPLYYEYHFTDSVVLWIENIGSKISGKSSGITEFISTGLDQVKSNDQIAWPNPVNDYLNVETNPHQVVSVEIFDLNGKNIKSEYFNHRMNVSAIKPGMYLVKIAYENNSSQIIKISKK